MPPLQRRSQRGRELYDKVISVAATRSCGGHSGSGELERALILGGSGSGSATDYLHNCGYFTHSLSVLVSSSLK